MNMPPRDLTVAILREIRDETRTTNARIDKLSERVDRMSDRLDRMGERMDKMHKHIVRVELNTATAISEMALSIKDLVAVIRKQSELRPRVEKCEAEIQAIKRLVG